MTDAERADKICEADIKVSAAHVELLKAQTRKENAIAEEIETRIAK